MSTVKAEQRVVGFSATHFDLAGEKLANARAVGCEAALSELVAAYHEHLTMLFYVADKQATGLACT